MPSPVRYKVDSIVQEGPILIAEKHKDFKITRSEVKFNTTMRLKVDDNRIFIQMTIKYLSKADDEQLLLLTTQNVFLVVNFQEAIKTEENQVELPDNLLIDIIGVSINTARGIIMVRTENTFLKDILLGTMDPKLLLQSMKNAISKPKD